MFFFVCLFVFCPGLLSNWQMFVLLGVHFKPGAYQIIICQMFAETVISFARVKIMELNIEATLFRLWPGKDEV